MINSFLYLLLAVFAGVVIPFQSAINTQLGKSLQSPYYSALTVFMVAVIGLAVYTFIMRQELPTLQQFTNAPKWSYLGGILGGTYTLLVVICAPRLGIGNVTIMVLLGQVLAAMIVDQLGLFNTPIHAISWQRLVGVVLVVAGAYIVRKF
ncbi:DMT family transporter [Spirosoma endbachense]|uniref:EamA-like transporter family protein n=1 Tax=Spirosoma endbachense TaxID=2666025 RepID=A0A6P1VX82_9BACT|nr:DMT family transporter [Spirosoma endbachense]QHV97723.1 EamA-like transporter family protein [Spirosoma endbachense]